MVVEDRLVEWVQMEEWGLAFHVHENCIRTFNGTENLGVNVKVLMLHTISSSLAYCNQWRDLRSALLREKKNYSFTISLYNTGWMKIIFATLTLNKI